MKTILTELPNGVFIYEDAVSRGLFSDEEIKERDTTEAERQAAALAKPLADGFVEVPVWFTNAKLEPVEKKAWVHPSFLPSCSEGFLDKFGMAYNIYIPSYGRAKESLTTNMLKLHGVGNYYLAIDPDQYEEYSRHHSKERLIIRDISFRDSDMVDMGSSVKSPRSMHGTSGLYNFLLAFSRSMGERRYWTMDDDIINMAMKARKGDQSVQAGEVYDKNNFYRCSSILPEYGFNMSEFLRGLEIVGEKSRNAGFIGAEKFGIVFSLPISWKRGTRVYSFYLSDNKNQVRHIGQHNNDVATSLELSKSGMVNMLFEGICYNSGATQDGTGGLAETYRSFGTLDKGKVLCRLQPNYCKIIVNYNRIHHSGNYLGYNKQRLVGAVVE